LLFDLLIDLLPSTGMVSDPIDGPLDPEARYIVGIGDKQPPHSAKQLRAILRGFGWVADYKYVVDWPAGKKLFIMGDCGGATGAQINAALAPYVSTSVVVKCQHQSCYQPGWKTSADMQQKTDSLPDVRAIIAIVLVIGAVALVAYMEK